MAFVQKSRKDNWRTPTDEIIDVLTEHVEITLDPCPGPRTEAVHRTEHGIVNFYPDEYDGLTRPWDVADYVVAFVNPPFSGKLRWLRRAIGQFLVGNVDLLIFLTPDNTDAAESWHAYVAAYFPFTWFAVSRVDFVDPGDGEQASGVSFNTALHLAGDVPVSLVDDLDDRGDLVRRPVGGRLP